MAKKKDEKKYTMPSVWGKDPVQVVTSTKKNNDSSKKMSSGEKLAQGKGPISDEYARKVSSSKSGSKSSSNSKTGKSSSKSSANKSTASNLSQGKGPVREKSAGQQAKESLRKVAFGSNALEDYAERYRAEREEKAESVKNRYGIDQQGGMHMSPLYIGGGRDTSSEFAAQTHLPLKGKASGIVPYGQRGQYGRLDGSPYGSMSYREMTDEIHNTFGGELRRGNLSQMDYYLRRGEYDIERIQKAGREELEEMLQEKSNEYQFFFNMRSDINEWRETGDGKSYREVAEERAQNLDVLMNEIQSRIRRMDEDKRLAQSYDAGLIKYGSEAMKSGGNGGYVPTKSKMTEYDYINRYHNGELNDDALRAMQLDYKNWTELTDAEIKIFNDLHAVNPDTAFEFIRDMEGTLNRRLSERRSKEAYEYAQEHPYLAGAKSVVQNVAMGLPAAVDNLVEGFTGDVDTYDETSRAIRESQALRQGGSEYMRTNHGALGEFAYNTGLSIVENLANVALFKGAGKAAAGLVAANMASNAASHSMISIAERGGNDFQIVTGGVASGMAEYIFEKFSVEKLFDIGSTKGIKNIIKAVAVQSGVEGSEEIFTEVANIFSDAVIMQGDSESNRRMREYVMQGTTAEEAMQQVFKENIQQIAMAGAAGALSGGVMGGGAVTMQNISHSNYMNSIGENLINDNERLNRVITLGLESGNADARYTAEILNEGMKINGKQAGKLLESVIGDSISKDGGIVNIINNIYALEGREPKYIGSKESIDTAKAVVNMVQGQATDVDRALLQRSPGAVTLLTAIEGNDKAWESVRGIENGKLKAESYGRSGAPRPADGTMWASSSTDGKASGGVRYKYAGTTKDGIKKYVTDFPADMDYKAREKVFKERIATVFNLGAVKLNTDTKKIQVMGDRFTAQKNIHGDKKATDSEMQAKVNSLYDIAEILNDSRYVGKSIEESYKDSSVTSKNQAHKGVRYWYKFKNTISMDGVVYDVVFNIRDKGKEQYQYLIDFHKKSDDSNQPYGQKDLRRAIDESSPTNRVPQNEESVNSNSMRDSEIYSQGKAVSIPEKGRVARNIVLNEESARVRKERAKDYKIVETMARDLGMRVMFVKGLTDSAGNDLDGIVTSKGIILNSDAKNLSRFAATHEFSHGIKQKASGVWNNYQQYVIDTLKKDGRYYAEYEKKAAAYNNSDENFINEEIAADYIGELFNNESELADFIRDNKSSAFGVRNMWYTVLDKLGLLDEKRKAQHMWMRAYKAAMKNKDGKVEGETKYSIRRIVCQNKDYGIGVYLDSDTLTGLTEKERIRAVKEHVKKIGGKDFVAYDKNGKPARIRIAKHSWKYKNKNGAEIRVNNDLTSFLKNEVKQESIVLVDELISSAKYEESLPAKHSHGWLDNHGKNNWDYWKVFIQEKNKTVWEATLNVTNSANGEKILYDIYPIEMVEGAVTSATTATNNTVSQKPPGVNRKSISGTRMSDMEGETIPPSAEADTSLYTREAVEAENAELRKQLARAEAKNVRQKISWNKSEVKKKIDSDYNYIRRMVTEPTDARHIPEDMRVSVAYLMDCFNFETKQLDRIKDEGKEADSTTAVRLSKMYDAYADIMRKAWGISPGNTESELLDQHLSADLQELRNEIPLDESGEFKRIQDMSIEELRAMSKVLMSVHHVITQRNKAFNRAVKEEISELGEASVLDMRKVRDRRKGSGEKLDYETDGVMKAVKGIDKYFNIDNIQPWDFFHGIGGTIERLYMEERKAFDRHIENIREASKMLKKATENVDLKKVTGNKAEAIRFQLDSGETIRLSKGQILSIYALYQRKQGKDHILGGGIVTNNEATNKDGDNISANSMHRVTEADIGEMFDTLSEDEKAMVSEVVNFLSKRCSVWGNETSMKLYGYEKYGEGWYFPIKVSNQTLNTYYGEHGEGSIRSQGFTKQLVKNAKNAVEVGDFFDVVTSHINGMSLYNTVAIPMLDMERVLNYTDSDIETKVRQEIIKTFGKAAEKYIALFHKDVNGSRKTDDKDPFIERRAAAAKAASIGLNARVFLQQPTSIVRTLLFMNPIDFPAVWNGVKMKEEMQENVPIAYWKSLGFRDIGVGSTMKEVLLDNESLYSKAAFGAYGAADDFTWTLIYGAVKNEVARKNPDIDKNSEQFREKVRERFNYIVDRSQVVDSVFHRTQNMRSGNAYTKTATMFMSEPLKTYNMYRTEMLDAVKNGQVGKKAARATAVFFVSNVLLSIAQALPDAWREDDEKELYKDGKRIEFPKLLLKKFTENMIDNSNPFTYLPYIKDVWSMIQGYSQERIEYSNISDLIATARQLTDGKKTLAQRVLNFAKPATAVFGISGGNLIRDVKSLASAVWRMTGEEYADYQVDKFSWNIRNPENKSRFMKYYKRAMQNGHTEDAEAILSDYMAETFGGDYKNKHIGKVMAETSKLYGKTGDSKLIYNIPDDEFSDDGKKVKLSDKEYSGYVKGAYDTLWDMAYEFVNSEGYKGLSDEDKVRSFGEIRDYAQKSQRMEYVDGYELSGWQEKVYSGETKFIDSVTERSEEREYQAERDEFKDEFEFDASKYNEAEIGVMEKVESDAASYYASKEKGMEYDEKTLRHIQVYDEKLSEYMEIEEYAGHRAKAKKEAAMADGKPTMKKDELKDYLDSTDYDVNVKRALFEAIGNSNWKNPY